MSRCNHSPEEAIKAACRLIDDRGDVFASGTGALIDPGREEIAGRRPAWDASPGPSRDDRGQGNEGEEQYATARSATGDMAPTW